MPKYMLLLDSGIGRPIEEILVAADDAEARMLAELRLSLTTDFLQVAIVRDSQLLQTLTRDSVTCGRRRIADRLLATPPAPALTMTPALTAAASENRRRGSGN